MKNARLKDSYRNRYQFNCFDKNNKKYPSRKGFPFEIAAHPFLLMAFSFNEHTKAGEAISINSCFFGPYGLNGLYATQPSGGKVFLKEKRENNLVLRFKGIRFFLDDGEYQLNGDLTFLFVN